MFFFTLGETFQMVHIHDKTLQDLELYTVLQQVSELCITPLGAKSTLEILPYKTRKELEYALKLTNEYVSYFYIWQRSLLILWRHFLFQKK